MKSLNKKKILRRSKRNPHKESADWYYWGLPFAYSALMIGGFRLINKKTKEFRETREGIVNDIYNFIHVDIKPPYKEKQIKDAIIGKDESNLAFTGVAKESLHSGFILSKYKMS